MDLNIVPIQKSNWDLKYKEGIRSKNALQIKKNNMLKSLGNNL